MSRCRANRHSTVTLSHMLLMLCLFFSTLNVLSFEYFSCTIHALAGPGQSKESKSENLKMVIFRNFNPLISRGQILFCLFILFIVSAFEL